MSSQKMTTTTANEPAVTLENSRNCTLVWDDAGHQRCVFLRVWKWLWPDRSVGDPEAHKNPQSPPLGPIETSGEPAHVVSPGTQIKSSECVPENMRCRACQSKGVECDLQRPRCSHCLDEQILCFYVAPLRLCGSRWHGRRSKGLRARNLLCHISGHQKGANTWISSGAAVRMQLEILGRRRRFVLVTDGLPVIDR